MHARAGQLGFDRAQHLHGQIVGFFELLVAPHFQMQIDEFMRAGTACPQIVEPKHAVSLITAHHVCHSLIDIVRQPAIRDFRYDEEPVTDAEAEAAPTPA